MGGKLFGLLQFRQLWRICENGIFIEPKPKFQSIKFDMSTKQRTVNYFKILPKFKTGKNQSDIISLFKEIRKLGTAKDLARFEQKGDKLLYITDIKVDATLKQIQGMIYSVRTDVFPEILDITDDKIRDVNATADEGICEKSHFIISYKRKETLLAFEQNNFGAWISDIIYYIEKKGLIYKIWDSLGHLPISNDDLKSTDGKINRVSLVVAKVHKNNIARVKKFDADLFTAFQSASEASYAEYVTLEFKYDYKKVQGGQPIRSLVHKLIGQLANKKSHPFEILKVKGENAHNNNLLRDFDLLNLWVKSKINIEKRPKTRTLISSDAYDKIKGALFKEFGV